MDQLPKAIQDAIAEDPEGEVEIVLRRTRPTAEPQPSEKPTDDALQASINRGKAKPRTPTSYALPKRARQGP